MRKFISCVIACIAMGSVAIAADNQGTQSFVSAPNPSQPMIVDTWGNVDGAVRDASGALSTGVGAASGLVKGLLLDWANGKEATLAVSEALAKIPGMPSGRVLQAAIVDKLGNAAAVVDAAIQTAFTIADATDAVQRGDKAAYQKAVADYIIGMTANIAGTLAGDATFAFLTGATVGLGALPAAAAGVGVGYLVTKGLEWFLNEYGRETLENLIGKYWDWLYGTGDNSSDNSSGNNGNGNGGPFDDDSEPGPVPSPQGGFQGLKPIKLL